MSQCPQKKFVQEGICIIAFAKGILICNFLKIFTNFSNSLSALEFFNLYRKGIGGIGAVFEGKTFSIFICSLDSPLPLYFRFFYSLSFYFFYSYSTTRESLTYLPLQRVITSTCSLVSISVLLGSLSRFLMIIASAIWTCIFLNLMLN